MDGSQLQVWREANDNFMEELYKAYVDMGDLPTVDEAVEVLAFFLSFSVGCRRLKLDSLAEVFSNRANLYVLGLEKLGFKKGWRTVGKWNRERQELDLVILRASGQVRIME